MKELYYSRIITQGWVTCIEISLESDNFRTISKIRWNSGKIWEIYLESRETVDFYDYHAYLINRINEYADSKVTIKRPFEDQVLNVLSEFYRDKTPIVYITDPVKQKQMELHSAQSGVDTPGCSCNHDGMGAGWHGSECDWIRSV